ncbi:Hypothetical Protein FCC1311_014122 [Hondaea fermentalgiana]|uniref:Uncharacterized protein n=1 Tax=Hondaea fermentalgiana TaxID=2315210 RepID=A0A2R5G3T5_9STRA|nr:Hypothetical Protein FCC1311_014122 [Hondaea fermentalgiana]|eukprot:GBG25195.1 Hypothetical Protein FCC1311_014122 [Hondaea fermentalgiana]
MPSALRLVGSPKWDPRVHVVPGTPATSPTVETGNEFASIDLLSSLSSASTFANDINCAPEQTMPENSTSVMTPSGWTRAGSAKRTLSKIDLHSSLSQRLYESTPTAKLATRARKLSAYDGNASFVSRRPSLALVMTIMLILIFVELQLVLYARQKAPAARLRAAAFGSSLHGGCTFVWANMQCSHGCCPRKFERNGNTVVACDTCDPVVSSQNTISSLVTRSKPSQSVSSSQRQPAAINVNAPSDTKATTATTKTTTMTRTATENHPSRNELSGDLDMDKYVDADLHPAHEYGEKDDAVVVFIDSDRDFNNNAASNFGKSGSSKMAPRRV